MTTDDLWKWPVNNYPYPPLSQPLAALVYPAQKAAFSEWLTNHTHPKVGWWDWRSERNYLFADGHVKYLPAQAIRPAVNNFPDPNLTRDGVAGRDVD
jgi:prepilin-type processing-associated H-X9-DG protein